MANTLGSLVVNLGLNAAEFTQGLSKADYQSQQFAKKMESQFRSIAAFIGTLGVGAAIGKFVHDTISAASALDDLSDATGSSVENLSKLANQAKISGTDFATLQSAMLKLSAGMAGADDESSNVGRALKALGVNTRDPAQALNEIAVALDKYADGVGKAAIARDLFGKSGPELLATLKDMAQLQDVAATTTTKQAAEAEKLEQALRRLTVEGTTFKNLLLNDVVPALSRLIAEMNEGIKIAGGFGAALMNFAFINPLKTTAENLASVNERIKDITNDEGIEARWAKGLGVTDRLLEKLRQQKEFLQFQQRYAATRFAEGLGDLGDQVSRANRKPVLDYTGGNPKMPSAAGVDQYARAMETFAKMTAGASLELAGLLMGEEKATQAMQTLAKLEADDVWKTFSEKQQAAIRGAAEHASGIEKETEALRKSNEEHEKNIKLLQDQAEAETKGRITAAAKVDDYALQNDIFKRQVAILGENEAAQQKLAAAVDYEAKKREIANTASQETLEKLDAEYEKRLKLIDAMEATSKVLEDQRKQKQFVDDLASAFGQAAESAIVYGRTFKDVLRSLEQDLVRILNKKLVTEPLEAMISSLLGGGTNKGGTGAGINWSSIISSLFGGGSGGSGWTSGYDLPIGGYASGTNFARGGIAMVGEHGPEAMYVPRGAQIIPNERLTEARNARGSSTISVNVSMPRGASRQTGAQFGAEVARGLVYAQRSL